MEFRFPHNNKLNLFEILRWRWHLIFSHRNKSQAVSWEKLRRNFNLILSSIYLIWVKFSHFCMTRLLANFQVFGVPCEIYFKSRQKKHLKKDSTGKFSLTRKTFKTSRLFCDTALVLKKSERYKNFPELTAVEITRKSNLTIVLVKFWFFLNFHVLPFKIFCDDINHIAFAR